MISYLEGKIISKKEKFVVLDVNGVGYRVFLSRNSFLKLPEIGKPLALFCYLDVKENSLNLYGFLSEKELEFFEILNDIRGVGPKTALEISILGSVEKIREKVLAQDEKLFSGIPGIGKKKAMTIILELTGKIKNEPAQKRATGSDEAEDALINLGFPKQRIKDVLEKIPKEIKTPEQKIKEALKLLTRT